MDSQVPLGNTVVSSIFMTSQEYLSGIHFPEEYRKPFDVYTKLKTKERKPVKWLNNRYRELSNFLMNFDLETDEFIEKLDKKGLVRNMDYTLRQVESSHQISENLVKVGDEALKMLNNPTVLFMAKKHYIISDIVLDYIEEKKETFREEIRNLSEEELKERVQEDKGLFRLGVFVSLEGVLITLLMVADIRKDVKFMANYSKLLDKYSYLIARVFPEKYKKKTELERPKVKK